MASCGSAWLSSATVRSAWSSSSARQASSDGSPDVSTRAHNHQIGPIAGWRSTMRRHAVTSAAGSPANRASDPATSWVSASGSAPEARAT